MKNSTSKCCMFFQHSSFPLLSSFLLSLLLHLALTSTAIHSSAQMMWSHSVWNNTNLIGIRKTTYGTTIRHTPEMDCIGSKFETQLKKNHTDSSLLIFFVYHNNIATYFFCFCFLRKHLCGFFQPTQETVLTHCTSCLSSVLSFSFLCWLHEASSFISAVSPLYSSQHYYPRDLHRWG